MKALKMLSWLAAVYLNVLLLASPVNAQSGLNSTELATNPPAIGATTEPSIITVTQDFIERCGFKAGKEVMYIRNNSSAEFINQQINQHQAARHYLFEDNLILSRAIVINTGVATLPDLSDEIVLCGYHGDGTVIPQSAKINFSEVQGEHDQRINTEEEQPLIHIRSVRSDQDSSKEIASPHHFPVKLSYFIISENSPPHFLISSEAHTKTTIKWSELISHNIDGSLTERIIQGDRNELMVSGTSIHGYIKEGIRLSGGSLVSYGNHIYTNRYENNAIGIVINQGELEEGESIVPFRLQLDVTGFTFLNRVLKINREPNDRLTVEIVSDKINYWTCPKCEECPICQMCPGCYINDYYYCRECDRCKVCQEQTLIQKRIDGFVNSGSIKWHVRTQYFIPETTEVTILESGGSTQVAPLVFSAFALFASYYFSAY